MPVAGRKPATLLKEPMSHNSFGHLFRITTWGESHGPAIGCVIDGCPPGIPITEAEIQAFLDKRKPGQSRYTTQRQEPDSVKILSGTFEGLTTGTPIMLMIENVDQRSKDYGEIKDKFRPGHADFTYWSKYGIRDYRGGGRSSARETAARVAAGAVARQVLKTLLGPQVQIRGALVQIGEKKIDGATWNWDSVTQNPFWCPDPKMALDWEDYLDGIRKSGSSVGAVVEVRASGIPAGLGGHGIGTAMHEDPSVPNTGRAGRGLPLREGLVLAIEPQFTAGGSDAYRTRRDGWTVVTTDGSLAAHWEHTVAVTADGPQILTVP